MKEKSQIKRIASRVMQMVLMLSIFITGGFILPLYSAPHIFSAMPITPITEREDKQVSVSWENRNAANGERIEFVASSPHGAAGITAVRYSCDIRSITLLYPTEDGSYKKLPCGKNVLLPTQSRHQLQVRTSRSSVAYVPITIRVTLENRTD